MNGIDNNLSSSSADEVLTPEKAGRIMLGRMHSSNVENAQNTQTNSILAGRTITADFERGDYRLIHLFDYSNQTVSWEVLSGDLKGNKGVVSYQAFEIRQGITLVMMQPKESEAVALIVDDNRGMAIAFLGRYSPDYTGTKVAMMPVQGQILEANMKSDILNASADLAGTRFTVASTDNAAIYEHIYLNEHYVTWLCHKGTSQGVADTEHYMAFNIAPNLYLLAWSEKSAPLQISSLLDFERNFELQSVFGFDEARGECVYHSGSSDITQVAHTNIEGVISKTRI